MTALLHPLLIGLLAELVTGIAIWSGLMLRDYLAACRRPECEDPVRTRHPRG